MKPEYRRLGENADTMLPRQDEGEGIIFFNKSDHVAKMEAILSGKSKLAKMPKRHHKTHHIEK